MNGGEPRPGPGKATLQPCGDGAKADPDEEEADRASRRGGQEKRRGAVIARSLHRVEFIGKPGDRTEEDRGETTLAKTYVRLHEHGPTDKGYMSDRGASRERLHQSPMEENGAAQERAGDGGENVTPGAGPIENRNEGKKHIRNDKKESGFSGAPKGREENTRKAEESVLPARAE